MVQCPECKREMKNERGLSMHLVKTHGHPKASSKSTPTEPVTILQSSSDTQPEGITPSKMLTLKESHGRKRSFNHRIAPQFVPHVLFLTGYLTAFIDQYCRGHEIPANAVASGVAESLQSQTYR